MPRLYTYPLLDGVAFNRDNKFDMQLSASMVRERGLGNVFRYATFDGTRPVSIELKSESWQWERTGNICIEYRQNGQRSGIAITEADIWVHELLRDGQTLCWVMVPIDRMKELARLAYKNESLNKKGGGDGGRFDNVVIPLSWVLK